MEINTSLNTIQQDENGSTHATPMESINNTQSTTSQEGHNDIITTESEPKKPSGSGPIPITMDIYHQLQQKRLLERQQQQQQQQPTISDENNKSEQSFNALEKIVNIVQATVPSLPLQTQPQQLQMPGPDLANIIFGHASSVGQTFENDSGNSNNPSKSIIANDGQSGHNSNNISNNNKQHRKSTSGAGSHPSASSQSQPRTTSPPTPVTGSSSHKNTSTKGPKPIHAIELIRIAAEILQFPPTTTGTALIYYHKYRAYLHQANKRGERDNEATKADEYLFATACLHLACKCTEVSRKVRDLVNVTYRVMNPSQPVLSLSTKPNETGDNSTPSRANNQQSQPLQPQHTYPTAPPPTVATYWHIRDSLLTTELMLLRILQFDLDVSMPFSDVLRIYKGMGMVFGPTDEEAAQLHPIASNFDVFLPVVSHNSSGLDSSQNKHGASSSSSSSSSTPPHTGIHPTLSALVQISTTFCIDALCSSNIALNSSSRALAMGAIYLAIRSAGLELPLPFEEWCYAWGRPNIATGFGIQSSGGVSGNSGLSVGAIGSSVGTGANGVNGIMGLTSGSNNLFVSSPRPASSDTTSFMEGIEMANGLSTKDSVYTQSPSVGNSSPAISSSMDGIHDQTTGTNLHHPLTIVDEVRKVVQELGSFYTH
ncbi:hypothetical protein BGZ76_011733 [Entomortierella beljakovae]|nr:hypothetical protein BGZ76_011733 [Entomortierella beljakovae]